MDAQPLHRAFGASIGDVDLNDAGGADLAKIREALARHSLLLFPRQSLSDAALLRFSRLLGDGQLEQPARCVSLSAQDACLANLTNLLDEHGRALGYGGKHTDYWHSDQEFRERPASLGLLYCVLPTLAGGETSFASTRLADLELDADDLRLLPGLRSTRRPAPNHDNAPNIEVSHQVIMRNPLTGNKSVYVSENVLQFNGLHPDHGAQLKRRLLDSIVRPGNIYCHQWQAGDLLIYDNTQLLHRREAYEGPRWLKATKIFPLPTHFAAPHGNVTKILEFNGKGTGEPS